MHIIKNNGIIQKIINMSNEKKIGVCGYDKAAIALERLLDRMGVRVERFLLLENDIQELACQDERIINLYDLMYEEEKFFVVEPHYDRVHIKFKNALGDLEYKEWNDFVHIFNNAIHQEVIVRFTECIDINLGVSWNQDEDGFTIYGDRDDDTYTIVTLGGSTTYSDQLVYAKCWSELLYYKCCQNGRKVCILCGGMPALDSTQELVKFLRDVIPMKPDMVLSFSGINDLVDSHGDFNDYGKGYPFAFPRLKVKMDQLLKDTQERNPLYLGRKSDFEVEDIWILNKKIMNFVAREMGIVFYTFLQPMLYCGDYVIDPEIMPKLEEYRKNDRFSFMFDHAQEFRDKIVSQIQNEDYIIDFTGIFDGCSKLFIDFAHVNEWGNSIIADSVFNHIKKDICCDRIGGRS